MPRRVKRSPPSCSTTLSELGQKKMKLLEIDHVNVGGYIRNTLAVDKNQSREDALFDIYRVMRPGEPPTIETGGGDVQVAVLRPGALRPLSGRPREDEHAARSHAKDTMRVLRKEDIAVIRTLVDLRDGRGEIDDIDDLGDRRVRPGHAYRHDDRRCGVSRWPASADRALRRTSIRPDRTPTRSWSMPVPAIAQR